MIVNAAIPTFKFIDDVTQTEIIDQLGTSYLQFAADQIVNLSHCNHMNINSKKTKETLLGSVLIAPPPPNRLWLWYC
jgi:hypothetical protein